MKVFISGPMTGIKDYNFPKFNEVEKKLIEKGIECVNPVCVCLKYKQERVVSDINVFNQMINDQLELLKTCTHILLLTDWHRSRGAKHELEVAIQNNIDIILESEIL
jgi:hypothetical protein